jgi:phage-related tail fiber protein
MSDYYNLLTNLGRSKITDLITSDAALENIQIAFGDGNGSVPTPNPARTALVNEVHRRPADKLEHHPTLTNNIIVDVVIPASVGSFWIREFGIYFDGVLICHGSLPPSYKEASEDGVNTYRLKPYINVESDRLKVVEIEGNLINATESWTQENFINRGEIADNLTTDDATKVASAKQVKILNDDKANKTTTLTAGNGLSGGGTLEANRTLTLGTPSKITGSTTNSVTATSHTHEIDNASISVAGVVKLNNTLTSTSTSEAATANTVKLLNDRFVNDFLSLKVKMDIKSYQMG